MPSLVRTATLTLCSVLALELAAIRHASALEAHLLVYNSGANAALVDMLEDATGFTVSLQGEFPRDRALSYKVVSYVRDACVDGSTAAFFAMDALAPTRFVGPVHCASIDDREAAVEGAKRTEDGWRETIRSWPAEVQGPLQVRVGAVLGKAYSKISTSCATDLVLRGFLPVSQHAAAGPLGAFGFTYCTTPSGEPVAPFADLAIVSSGIDATFASAVRDLSRRRPAIARRVARASLTKLLGTGSKFSYVRYSGSWTTTCTFDPKRGARVLGEVSVECRSERNGAVVSQAISVGSRPTSLSIVRVRAAPPLGVEDGLLVAGYRAVASQLDLAVATTRTRASIARVTHTPPSDASDVVSGPIYLQRGRALSQHSMQYAIRPGPGCFFWFESSVRVEKPTRTGGCDYGEVESVGATVFHSSCKCEKVFDDFATGAWTIP